MWRSQKFIIIALLVAAVVLGGTAGVVLARAGSGNPAGMITQNADNMSRPDTLLSRVATILGIDQQKVESAFTQAQKEMRDEALDSYLQKQVEQGKITQEQADQFKAWWQTRPDMGPFQQQLREWQQARPDIPLPGRGFGHFGGRGFRGGMR